MTLLQLQLSVLLLSTPILLTVCSGQSCDPPPSPRTDCGYLGINQEQCESKGCCWSPADDEPWCFYGSSAPGGQCIPFSARRDCGYVGIDQQSCENKGCCWYATDGEPWCFYKRTPETGYKVTSKNTTKLGWELTITSSDHTPYGENISPLTVAITMETAQRAHVKIYDPNNKRWEIPTSASPVPPTPTVKPSTTDYTIGLPDVGGDFYFSVSRTSGAEIFNTKATSNFMGLSFADQFLEISTALPKDPYIYGLGEHVKPLRLALNEKITLWNADQGTPNNSNIYGSHPFYMEMRQPGSAHGVFLRNSNGMDVVIGDSSLTFRTIGGILDFYFFLGPSPEEVVMQYQEVIGRPHMPVYWSLGFHNCRYGYHDVQTLEAVVANYSAAKIPLETMWTDIDYMDGYKDFTLDPVNFPAGEMDKFLTQLHSKGQHFVVIIDPGIANQNGYPAWDHGVQQDIFLKDKNGNIFIGRVWPGSTAFPDFLNPKAAAYWKQEINTFLTKLLNVDGLWIDMNEISNFCNGACSLNQERPVTNKPFFDPNNPPYAINNFLSNAPLDTKTTSMDAVHYGGVLEYNAHNIFGLLEAQATFNALVELKKQRSFVLSRSTFPGSGQFTAHWLGDNHATYFDLHYSVIGMLNFQMFGIPMVGADICGFIGDTTEELCSRWVELGVFYPFSRVHNTKGAAPQELYRWPSVAAIARKMYGLRYRLLPFYYTLFYNAHRPVSSLTRPASTVVRPMFFEFPSDPATYDMDQQFMVGSAILVCPVLEKGAVTKSVYFPKAHWYDLHTLAMVTPGGTTKVVDAPVEIIPVYLRGGSVVPAQESANTTTVARTTDYSLLIALDNQGLASGDLYIDDGFSLNPSTYHYIQFTVKDSTLTSHSSKQTTGEPLDVPPLTAVTVAGVTATPTKAVCNGQTVKDFIFDRTTSVLKLEGLQISITMEFKCQWT